MDFRFPGSRFDALKAFKAAIAARAASLFPLGIAARLTISLVTVALLAAAANMIARDGVSIVRMVTRSPVSAIPHPSGKPQATVDSAGLETKRFNAVTLAVDRFEQACQLRASGESMTIASQYLAARDALQRSVREYADGVPANAQGAAVAQHVADYLDRGRALVHVTDQRHLARIEYSRHSVSIVGSVQEPLNAAWKLFGRVIARQSLIQMRTDLDAIRQHSETIVSGEPVKPTDLDPILARENAFAAAFEANRSSLLKSEGRDWVNGVREDFDALVALRASLVSLNAQHDAALEGFLHARVSLSGAMVAAEPLMARAAPQIASSPAQGWSSPVSAPPADTVAETLLKRGDRDARNWIAAVTLFVMLVIGAISIFTVRSVVIPVRRILKAFGRLAVGDASVQVSRGGLKELDILAGAFNDMSSRLAAAQQVNRDQQETLEEKVAERTHQLQQLAQQDPLTSLPNRRHLSALLNAAIERAARENRHVGVYFLDIDNFKNFNDSLGHVFGDRVLMSVANRLEEMADGLGFVARLGGDEFTFVYEDAASVQEVHALGWDLVRAFHKLLSVDQRELSVSVSVGASIFPDHEIDAEALLRAADSALFRAKELGRSQLAVFTPQLIETAATRFATEQGLRRAIEGGEFELAYQPEVDLATMETGLVEALLRWRMPDGRLVRPGEFLEVAEQSGLISEISNWVLRTAITDASRWHHGGWPEARVAINISPRQLLDNRFIDRLLAMLTEFRLPAKCIELELTETVLQTGSATIAALRLLQSHGIGIALDDFGTGYSSLTSLEHLPLSRIKLDRSLIASIDTSARSAAIARAIIDLCGGLELEVTAEGIERPQQLAWLLGNRGMFIQGYLLSDAVPFADLLRVRASLVGKFQDLLLSLPEKPHHSRVNPKIRARNQAGTR
jgi:diguanylate cyclase (GGDEF)-like protein